MRTPSFLPAFRRPAPPAQSLCRFALLSAALALPAGAHAATYTWKGGGGNNAWSTAANWLGNAAPPSDLDNTDLIFGVSDAIFPSINSAYSIHALTWNAGASAYTFDSGPLTLGAGGFTQNAANAQAFGAPVLLGADQTWTLAAGTGALTFNGGVNTAGGPGGANRALTINAATTTGSGNVVNGNLTGGGSLSKTGAGILTLGGAASTYSGGTTISAGTLAFNNAGALGTGAVTLNGGELRAVADASLTQLVAFAGSTGAASAAPNTTLTLNSIGINAGTANFGAPGQTGVVVTGALISANDAADQRAVAINAGTLRIGSSANGGQGLLALSGAGTTIAAGATLDLNGVSVTVPGLNGAGSVLTGSSTSTVLTVNAGNFSGAVSGSGALTKNGTGALTLTGANTYAGATTVNGGALAVGSGGSVTGGNVIVNAGGTLAISGTGSVSPGSVKTLTVDGTSTSPASVTLAGSGALSTGAAYVGNNGVGSVTQSGGTFTTNSRALYLGYNTSGAYTLTGGSLSTSTAYVGFSGSGAFTQSGGTFTTDGFSLYIGYNADSTGAYTLSGAGSLTTGNTYVSDDANTSVFTQSGGSHTTSALYLGAFSPSANGTYHLDGGTLAANRVLRDNGTGVFNFNGGTLQARRNDTAFFQNLTTANVRGGGAIINTAGFNVTVAQPLLHSTIAGDAALDGGLTKNGAGTLTLTGMNTFTGPLAINAGALAVAAESALGAPTGGVTTINGGGQLLFTGSAALGRTYNLGVSTLAVGSGNTLTFNGASLNGGFLAGPGAGALGNGATLSGVTTLVNSTLTQAAGSTATLNMTTLRGALTQTGGTLNLNNGLVLGSGRVSIGGTVNATGTESFGVITVNNGGVLTNSGSSLYLSGGSRTTVNSGGTLSAASGTTIELSGGLLVNNGAQTGALNVNYGSTAKGSGTFGTINVGDGGRFSPGNSPGTATVSSLDLGAGGRYDFELNRANGTPGVNADLTNASGRLSLSAGTTANSRFVVALVSLDANDNPAPLGDFDASQSYTFTLITSAGIDGFEAARFTVDTSGFGNNLAGGSFAVVQEGNNLSLSFRPVPEPGTWALVLCGTLAGALVGVRRRREAAAFI